jgi:proteasome lid subunit RPN8/RPN11
MTGRVGLDAQTRERIERHAIEAYPNECCGAMFGTVGPIVAIDRGQAIVAVLPLPNSTDEGPRRRFLVSPDDYRRAERYAREVGLELVGFYHSHPDHPARPSEHDLARAWPTFWYLIASVHASGVADVRVWKLREDRAAFEEEELFAPRAVTR